MSKSKDKNAEGIPYQSNPSAHPIHGQPQDAYQMINKYGTYNIQPTNDTENLYPAIAQGLSEAAESKIIEERDEWLAQQGKNPETKSGGEQ